MFYETIKIIDSYKNDHTDSNDNATKTQKRHLLYICNLMKKYTISLVIILFCCYACSNDDDSNLNENNLDGEWNLAEILCYCDEIPTINEGEQVWEFETTPQNLKVVNAVSEPFLTSGDYGYTLQGGSLFIDNPDSTIPYKYKFSIESDTLRLEDEPELDGPILILVRN